jgi:membrane-associated phospholipid phosphatase
MDINKCIPNVILNPINNWTNILHIVINFIYYIGEYMDFIIIFLGLLTLRNNCLLIIFYLAGVGCCIILNYILKIIIQIPRPCINQDFFNMLLKNKEKFVSRNGKKYNIYGMPSGHLQLCGYTLVFISLFIKNYLVSLMYLFVALLTMYQRVIYEHNSVLQVIIGVLVGGVLGVGMYYQTKNQIIGNLAEKDDDLCFIYS